MSLRHYVGPTVAVFVIALVLVSLATLLFYSFSNVLVVKNATLLLLSLSNLFLLTALVLFPIAWGYAVRRIQRNRYSRQTQSLIAKQIQHYSAQRGTLIAYLFDTAISRQYSRTDLDRRVHEFLKYTVNHTSALFTQHTGAQCAACIKLLYREHTDDDKPLIRTLVRDDASQNTRWLTDEDLAHFGIAENTAFFRIVTDSVAEGFYGSNDLPYEADHGRYINSNPHWRRHYTASIVTAIKHPDGGLGKELIGFLCVDNYQGNFDMDYCRYQLTSIAYMVYFVLKIWSFIHDNLVNQDGKEEQMARVGGSSDTVL